MIKEEQVYFWRLKWQYIIKYDKANEFKKELSAISLSSIKQIENFMENNNAS